LTGVPAGISLNVVKGYKTVDETVASREQWQAEIGSLDSGVTVGLESLLGV